MLFGGISCSFLPYSEDKTLPLIILVYTTQVNSAFPAHWLASSKLISQVPVLFTFEQLKKKKWLPVSNKVILKQVKLLFGPLVIQLVWYTLKNNYSPQCQWKWWIFTSTSVNTLLNILSLLTWGLSHKRYLHLFYFGRIQIIILSS